MYRERFTSQRGARYGAAGPAHLPAAIPGPLAKTMTQRDKAVQFRALHEAPGVFVIPNPWDGASARILASLGYRALTTSSAAAAATFGRRDGRLTRDEALAHCRMIAESVDLPVAGDLENGFGDAPEVVAETIRLASDAGLVGGSIEDSTGRAEEPLYDVALATERVVAAVRAARALPFPFTLVARAEGFIRGRPDLEDVIRRLQAYERAGADVLFAPGLPDLDAIRRVCASVGKPVNVMAAMPGRSFTVANLAAAGVKRVSLAASLHRAAMTALRDAAREVQESGTFGYLERIIPSPEFGGYLKS